VVGDACFHSRARIFSLASQTCGAMRGGVPIAIRFLSKFESDTTHGTVARLSTIASRRGVALIFFTMSGSLYMSNCVDL
jgi:hypothetical protein